MVARQHPTVVLAWNGHAGSQPNSSNKSVVKLVQTFDDHLRMGQNRHEIRIAIPAGNDMPVQVSRQAGTRRLALVEPDIVSLRLEHPIEDGRHPPNRLDRLQQVRALQLTAVFPDAHTGRRGDVHYYTGSGSRQRTNSHSEGQPSSLDRCYSPTHGTRSNSARDPPGPRPPGCTARQGAQIRFSTILYSPATQVELPWGYQVFQPWAICSPALTSWPGTKARLICLSPR